MVTYGELAPIIQNTGVTKISIDTYFENLSESPTLVEDPTITKTKIEEPVE